LDTEETLPRYQSPHLGYDASKSGCMHSGTFTSAGLLHEHEAPFMIKPLQYSFYSTQLHNNSFLQYSTGTSRLGLGTGPGLWREASRLWWVLSPFRNSTGTHFIILCCIRHSPDPSFRSAPSLLLGGCAVPACVPPRPSPLLPFFLRTLHVTPYHNLLKSPSFTILYSAACGFLSTARPDQFILVRSVLLPKHRSQFASNGGV